MTLNFFLVRKKRKEKFEVIEFFKMTLNFFLVRKKRKEKFEIIEFFKIKLNFFLVRKKRKEKKVAGEYCWVISRGGVAVML